MERQTRALHAFHTAVFGQPCDERGLRALHAFHTAVYGGVTKPEPTPKAKGKRATPSWATKPRARTIVRGRKNERFLSSTQHKLPTSVQSTVGPVSVPMHIRRGLLKTLDADMIRDAANFAVQENKLTDEARLLLPHYSRPDEVKLWLDAIPDGDVAHVYFCYDNTRTTVPEQSWPYPGDEAMLAMQNENDARHVTGAPMHMETKIPVRAGPKLRWHWLHQVPPGADGPLPVPSGSVRPPLYHQDVPQLTIQPAEAFARYTRNGMLGQAARVANEAVDGAGGVQSLLRPVGQVARGVHECYEALGVRD